MPADADLRALAASGAVGLCSWTLGRDSAPITAADDAFLALVGRTRESVGDFSDLDWRALTPPEWTAALDERFTTLMETGSHPPREQEILTTNGQRASVLVASALVDAAAGTAVSVCVDFSEQVRARADAERASQAKSRFLGVMTHELRTPLNTIIGQTELIADGAYGDVSDGQRTALARLRSAGGNLRAMVDDVLLFSRLETGVERFAVEALPLAGALEAAAAAVESRVAAKPVALRVETPRASLVVHADGEKLHRLLLALLSNAVKFTPAGGRIILGTAERAEISDYVFVRVSDSGSGIARDRQDVIFEPFAQGDEGHARAATGLGLGLTISRDLARGMGGDVRVRSAQGAGSTFTLSLRRAE